MEIIEKIGVPAMLEQLAEECNELAHAALKYARLMRGDNPTPMSEESCFEALDEETADVLLVIKQLLDHKVIGEGSVNRTIVDKEQRWKGRLGIPE